jgi:hypothetical protein
VLLIVKAFGFLSLVAFLVTFREPKRQASNLSLGKKLARMDLGGTTLLIAGIVLLFTGLQLGGNEDPWTSARVLVCLIVAGLCLVTFGVLQWYLKEK